MSIATLDDVITAQSYAYNRQLIKGSITTVASTINSIWATGGGDWPAGTLTIGNTTTGLVPTTATAGALPLPTNPIGGRGRYLVKYDLLGIAGQVQHILYDRLFHVGSISAAALATTTLSTQPAITRAPADWSETEIMLETNVTIPATATTVSVQYTNESGTAGRTTPAQSIQSFLSGRCLMLPLQAGDKGVSKIEAIIVGGVASASGSFNIVVIRRLLSRPSMLGSGAGSIFPTDGIACGLKKIYDDSCISILAGVPSTFTGTTVLEYSIATA